MNVLKNNLLFLFLLLLVSLGWVGESLSQVVIIPRDGFPYCEPFTNSTFRPNTVVDGVPNNPILTGGGNGVLQLTPDDFDQRGWVYVDLPFSSAYGIKASFEYFAYGSSPINEKGDGFSFFLFDGSIDASTFEIGGLGGSLGYSPLRYSSDNNFLGGYGLKGAYMGIGLDSRGNWGNNFEGRYGGFAQIPPSPFAYGSGLGGALIPKYPNSIAIRGPIDALDVQRDNGMTGLGVAPSPLTFPQPLPGYQSYPFVDGRILNNDPTDGGFFTGLPGKFFLPSSQRFTVASASNSRVTDCTVDGYRKVFIDLRPNGAGSYTISMSILATFNGSQQVVPIFTNVPYPYAAPQNLKVGFAASSGAFKNRHEIRNVTVEVSSIDPALAPNPPNLNEKVCFNENLTFDFNVSLPADNQFIRCLQLYETNPGPPDNSPNTNGDPVVGNCGLSNVCIEKCKPENKKITIPGVGTFESILDDLTDQNFGSERSEAKIKFIPEPGFFGTHTIYYTVIDNYGLTSMPKTVTVTVNPTPKIDGTETIIGPTCNGQNDGTISNVIVKDLVPGYQFVWKDQAGNILPAANYTKSETTSNGYIRATLGVTNVNLGKYYLTINNPATNTACEDTFEFEVKDVRGTPVEVVLDDQEICQGTPVIFTPQLEDPTDANNPSFKWWKDNNKTQQITNGLSQGGVTYTITAPGILSITGLAVSNVPYEFFVEVAADASQNLCATPVGQLKRVQVLVSPPLVINATIVDDLCRENIGQITVNASGGLGTYTYSINGSPFQSSNVFSGLAFGTYTIDVNAGTNCIGSISAEVKTSPEIIYDFKQVVQPACGQNNGLLEVNFSGGTPPFTLEFLKNGVLVETTNSATSTKIYQNLSPGSYEVRIKDANCTKVLTQVLADNPGIPISVAPLSDELCEGDIASIIPSVTTTGNAVLKWYKDAAATQPITSSATPDANGHVFTINNSTLELTVGGLKVGNYKYYLVATGPGYCPIPPFEASIKVLSPITATVAKTDEICFNASDGTIAVTATGADGSFEYSLNNGAFVSSNTFTGLAPGNYTVTIRSTGPNGCQAQVSTTILGPPSAISVNTPAIIRNSCDLPNGAIENLQISGGWGGYTVEWRKGSLTGPVVAGDLKGAQNLISDTYYLIVKDAKGCVANFNFVVPEMPDPNFVVAPVEVCAGQVVTLSPINTVTGSAQTEIKWYKDAAKTKEITSGPDSTDPSISYTIDVNTDQLIITGLKGNSTPYSFYFNVVCTNQLVEAKALVRVVPAPIFATEPVSCFGGNDGVISVSSGGNSNYTYSVNNGAILTEAQLKAQTWKAGIYSIKVTNQGFCEQTFSVEVKQPASALAISPLTKVDPSCGSDIGIITTQITGGWSPYTVTLIKNGVATPSVTVAGPTFEAKNLSPGTYSISVVDKEGCSISSTPITLVYGPTNITVPNVEICEGEQAVLIPTAVPTATGATFEWYKDNNLTQKINSSPVPDGNGHTFTIASNGALTVSGLSASNSPRTYYVIIKGGNSCPGQVTPVQVKINRVPTLVSQIQNEVCFGEKGTIRLTGGAGDGVFTYSLDGTNFQTGNTFSVVPGTYTGYVKSGAGCIVSLPNLVVAGPPSALQITTPTKKDSDCNASNGNVVFDVSGGYGQYTIDILRNGTQISSRPFAGGTFNSGNLAPGSYQFIVKDAGGCIISLPSAITVDELPTPISTTDDVICEGETAQLVPSTTQTGITPVYTWYQNSNGTGQISSGTSNGVTYQIAPNGSLSISGLQGRDDEYVYYVKVSGTGVCESALIPAKVKVYDIPNLRVSNPSIVCDPKGTVDLTKHIEGFNPSIYDYQVISPSGAAMKIDEIGAVNQNGNYLVSSSIKGAGCWTPTQRIQVKIAEEELISNFDYQADLGGGNFIPNGVAQILEPVNFNDLTLGKAIIWNWEFGDGAISSDRNPTHIYGKKGFYTVTLTTIDAIGCISVFERVIEVKDDYVIIIPNAFTPDGSKNLFFKPQFRGIATVEYYIFNTWGELVFHTTSGEDPGWDGTHLGQKAPNGNYVYRALFTTRSGEKIERSGVFILIR
ncbi:gliding motility-associated-like protein [Algoriphagus boseongensis]|uniref:Gliding motility-associated-like protein n=1 Tax=Algoriphagus boseongensis TaxID=1442587 RepID=A0A4V3D2N3_9BACT|nr:PKD domain-containing protein [Algoriphagus boseongensis]TDQ19607.1 gliding motility-associated-like protein [Algoriphagus boseongensis]